MRAYFFANSWLSGIQKSLQAAHVVAEMATMATLNPTIKPEGTENKAVSAFWEWANSHKTILILDGGASQDLISIKEMFAAGERCWSQPPHGNLWAHFCEDEESLNGAMTCVGIILPERIYETAKIVREEARDKAYVQNVLREFTEWEIELIKLINSRPLAR